MITNMNHDVTTTVVKKLFNDHGYKVEYIHFLWNGLNGDTVYPECYKFNMPLPRTTSAPICGGVWQLTLQNPKVLEEPDKPFIFCSIYDLKVETTCDFNSNGEISSSQAELEDIWFKFENAVKKPNIFEQVDFTNKKTRNYFIKKASKIYNAEIKKYSPNTIASVGIDVPKHLNPSLCYSAQMKIKKIVREAQEKQQENSSYSR